MKILKSITAILGLAMICPSALAQDGEEKADKIASVNMMRLVKGYYKTKLTQDSFLPYQERLKEADKKRVEEINALYEEAKALRESVEGKSVDADKRSQVFQEASVKKQRGDNLQKGRIAWAKQKEAAFKDKINTEIGEHRKEIIEVIQKHAKAEGYDFIFDRSGASGVGVPILSYAKDATDITGLLLELINKDAPKEKEEE